jgi:hypothetical protein
MQIDGWWLQLHLMRNWSTPNRSSGPLADSPRRMMAHEGFPLDLHRRTTLGRLIEDKARDMTELLSNVLELMRLETAESVVKVEWHVRYAWTYRLVPLRCMWRASSLAPPGPLNKTS